LQLLLSLNLKIVSIKNIEKLEIEVMLYVPTSAIIEEENSFDYKNKKNKYMRVVNDKGV
jgi:hypothetical protein